MDDIERHDFWVDKETKEAIAKLLEAMYPTDEHWKKLNEMLDKYRTKEENKEEYTWPIMNQTSNISSNTTEP